ncbi:MAG: recombination-associated protein RdgC [Dokdonella sp.]|uniref:recombination-associated protein RdgC n=1 Tax=Dokdonella sp. TaxID=2291710 RepID=UPI002C37ED14|nr:recombination-associated protein RdgC [Dokdonella sp.]
MFFRNLTLFRFPDGSQKSLAKLEGKLDEHRLRPCGPIEMATRGFVSPFGRESDELLHRIGKYTLVTIGSEDKLLPSSVIAEALAAKIGEITEKEARRIGARERKRLKEEVMTDLLPRAFVRPSRMFAYLAEDSGWLVIDTASRKAAEEAVSQIREALGRFPATPMAPSDSPRALMTDWLVSGKLPAGLSWGDECELRDPSEAGAVVRCRRQDLESDEVREHLKSGKQVFQLGLELDERMAFVLGEDLTVRKFHFLDVVLDEIGEEASESARTELDARFALMTLETRRLLEKLDEWFGLPRPDERD